MTQTVQNNQQPIIVKKVVKVKRKRSLLEFLIGTVILLTIIIIVGATMAFSAWMYTFNALTNEQVVGELRISKKIIKDGIPSYTVRYTQIQQDSAIPFINKDSNSNNNVFESTMSGDQVFIDANFIRWQNWLTLIGFKPVYKMYRIKSDFLDTNDRNNYKSNAFDMNGGSDQIVQNFSKSSQNYEWFVQSAFISSAGQNITDQDQVYNVIVTKDAVVLEKK